MLVHVNKDNKTVTITDDSNELKIPNLQDLRLDLIEDYGGKNYYRVSIEFEADTIVVE